MNSSNLRGAPINSCFSYSKRFYETYLPQEFSIPLTTMRYIWERPLSPKGYEKLIQCCKFFFIKNPILVFKNLEYNTFDEWTFCDAIECNGKYICKSKHERFNINKVKAKIWITKRFCVKNDSTSTQISIIAASFILKCFQFDATIVEFMGQKLSYNELKYFTLGIKEFQMFWSIVKYENDKEVLLENIIKLFAGAKKVRIDFGLKSYNADCKCYDDFIDACQSIKEVDLHCIPNKFDVPQFYQCLKLSKNRTLINIFSRDYIPRLNEVIGEIMETQIFEFVPPIINHSGLGKIKFDILKEIQKVEDAKYH